MKKNYLSSFCLVMVLTSLLLVGGSPDVTAQIKIGNNGTNIAPASLLELESTDRGLLIPRMPNTTAIDALNPPVGMLIYITTEPSGIYIKKTAGWEYLTGFLGGNAFFNSVTVTGQVTAGNFTGPLNGNATSANTATNATNTINAAIINDLSTPQPVYPTFVLTTPGNSQLRTSTTKLSFVPNTGILTATGFSGPLTGDVTGNATSATNATNASNTDILNEVASAAIHYPTFVTGTSGNLPHLVSSAGFNYIPATGTLTATQFSGSLLGNASTATLSVNATNAANVGVSNDASSAGFNFPVFVGATTGNQALKTGDARLRYRPSTGELFAGTFVGPLTGNVTGSASSATNATNSTNIGVSVNATNATMYPTFVSNTSGALPANVNGALTYHPQTGALASSIMNATTFNGSLSGNATSATSVTGLVTADHGGTGHNTYAAGDILYASGPTTLDRLPRGTTNQVLRIGAFNVPEWSTAGSGTVTNVTGTTSRISVINNTSTPVIDIDAAYTGQASITTVGIIANGAARWRGGIVEAQYGGTGTSGFTANEIVIGGGINNSLSSISLTGTANKVLTSHGPGFLPTFEAAGVGDMILASPQVVLASKSFNDGTLILNGSSGGVTTLHSSASANSDITLPSGTRTLVSIDGTETLTAKTLVAPNLTGITTFQTASGTQLILGSGTPLTTTDQTGTAGRIVMSNGPTITNTILAGNTISGGITATGTVTATYFDGPSLTANNVGTGTTQRSALTVATGVDLANAATDAAVASTIVKRDGSNNFTANMITANLTGNVTGNISGNAATVTTNANLVGEVTSTGNNTLVTNSAVINKVLTGFLPGSGAVAATDNIVTAFGKVQGSLNAKAPILNPDFTAGITTSSIVLGSTTLTPTGTELNFVDGVTSPIQTQLNAKQAALTSSAVLEASLNDEQGSGFVVFSDSPEFTGTPTAPTAAGGTNDTQIATTAFVTNANASKANINSPTFTGVPLSTTAASTDNSTRIATTAFVKAVTGMIKLQNVPGTTSLVIPAGGEAEVDYAATGAQPTGTVVVSPNPALVSGLGIMSARISANSVVTVRYRNFDAVNPLSAGALNITVIQ